MTARGAADELQEALLQAHAVLVGLEVKDLPQSRVRSLAGLIQTLQDSPAYRELLEVAIWGHRGDGT